jgi:hypothetical protein
MTSGLTFQTERELRYEQRCKKKRIEQQNIDRTVRFQNREKYRDDSSFDRNEITKEVSSAISSIAGQKSRFATVHLHFRRYSSYSSLRF